MRFSNPVVCSVWLAVALAGFSPQASAQLAARSTEDWLKTLDSANRVAKLKIDEVVAALKLKPNSVA